MKTCVPIRYVLIYVCLMFLKIGSIHLKSHILKYREGAYYSKKTDSESFYKARELMSFCNAPNSPTLFGLDFHIWIFLTVHRSHKISENYLGSHVESETAGGQALKPT